MAGQSTEARVAETATALGLTIRQQGAGRTILLLHGGAGPGSVAGLMAGLAAGGHVIAPVHPGFAGSERPAALASVAALADLYARFVTDAGLAEVTLVGASIGGWIASELALRIGDRLRGIVLVNAVGIRVPGVTVADVFTLAPPDMARLAFHDPSRLPPPSEEQRAAQPGNMAALRAYDAGMGMGDPTLAARLSAVTCPALVIWGESDGIAPVAYGRAYAQALPGGRFAPVAAAGHLPQIEQPAETLRLIEEFIGGL